MIAPELLEQLVAELGDRVAERVFAALGASPAASVEAEPWRLLDLAEVCERLGRSERQVRGWVRSGELPHVRLDAGKLMFDLDDVRAFARARTINADAPEVLARRLQGSSNGASGAGSRRPRRAVDRSVPRG